MSFNSKMAFCRNQTTIWSRREINHKHEKRDALGSILLLSIFYSSFLEFKIQLLWKLWDHTLRYLITNSNKKSMRIFTWCLLILFSVHFYVISNKIATHCSSKRPWLLAAHPATVATCSEGRQTGIQSMQHQPSGLIRN